LPASVATTPPSADARPRLGRLLRARPLDGRRLIVAGLLAAVVAGAGLLRFEAAGDRPGYVSADQRSYVRLAADLRHGRGYGDPSMKQPFHWAPGAPALFALADAVSGHSGGGIDEHAARNAQALASTLTVLAAFALAALLAGPWAGLAAAVVVAFYPPFTTTTGYLVSEPLGALAIVSALVGLVWAWRGQAPWRYVIAGLAFGLACLVRADVALVALLLPLVVGALCWRRTRRWRPGVARACAMLAGVALAVAPWTVYASKTADHFVPITDGGASTLFVATYLPGHGTIYGLKRALEPEAARRYPTIAAKARAGRLFGVPERYFLNVVAARHPHRGYEAAMRAEVRHNLRVYALGRPAAFAGMLVSKLWRMWGSYYHGSHHIRRVSVLWVHRGIALLAALGLIGGLARVRRTTLGLVLLTVLLTTCLDVFFVAEPRHAFRLMPALIAGGAAGWALLLSAGRAPPRASTAPLGPPPRPGARSAG
jgi:4-amino-4-deoxy-L-arabinose transferase-like glycosyltransferase